MTFPEFIKYCENTLNPKIPQPSEILVESGKSKIFYRLNDVRVIDGKAYALAVQSRIDRPAPRQKSKKK